MIDTIREFSDVKGLIVVADGTNLNQGTVSGGVAWSGEKRVGAIVPPVALRKPIAQFFTGSM